MIHEMMDENCILNTFIEIHTENSMNSSINILENNWRSGNGRKMNHTNLYKVCGGQI